MNIKYPSERAVKGEFMVNLKELREKLYEVDRDVQRRAQAPEMERQNDVQYRELSILNEEDLQKRITY